MTTTSDGWPRPAGPSHPPFFARTCTTFLLPFLQPPSAVNHPYLPRSWPSAACKSNKRRASQQREQVRFPDASPLKQSRRRPPCLAGARSSLSHFAFWCVVWRTGFWSLKQKFPLPVCFRLLFDFAHAVCVTAAAAKARGFAKAPSLGQRRCLVVVVGPSSTFLPPLPPFSSAPPLQAFLPSPPSPVLLAARRRPPGPSHSRVSSFTLFSVQTMTTRHGAIQSVNIASCPCACPTAASCLCAEGSRPGPGQTDALAQPGRLPARVVCIEQRSGGGGARADARAAAPTPPQNTCPTSPQVAVLPKWVLLTFQQHQQPLSHTHPSYPASIDQPQQRRRPFWRQAASLPQGHQHRI